MATDEERREVAARLRAVAEKLGPNMDAHEFAHYTADMLDIGESMTWYEMVLRLADLIEPSGYECVPGECPLNVRHDNDRIDRDALLEQVKELEKCAWYFGPDFDEDEPLRDRLKEASEAFSGSARRIRKALGVVDEAETGV